ncbi:MAG: TetR/AcrR family transcriptional regulator [Acidimicrobiia bacterium]
MSSARQDLLDRVIAYVAANGMIDASLRTLASGIGTSHRMLIYHFGSREGLIAAIVTTIETQQRVALEDLAEVADSPTALVRMQWAQLTDPALLPFIRLFFEVLAYASRGQPGTEEFVANLTEPWIRVASDVSARLGIEPNEAELRLGVAVVRGLLVEIAAGGDVALATESLERYLEMWGMFTR